MFRKWYGKVCHIRLFVPVGTPVAATATKETCSMITQHMKLDAPCINTHSLNRPNIRYSVVKASRECDIAFQCLVGDLRVMRQNTPRVVVFCRSISTCTRLNKHFLISLREDSYEPPSSMPDIRNCMFAMFH